MSFLEALVDGFPEGFGRQLLGGRLAQSIADARS